MTKNLLKEIMLKPTEENDSFETEKFVETIQNGYLADRGTKFQTKKTFGPQNESKKKVMPKLDELRKQIKNK